MTDQSLRSPSLAIAAAAVLAIEGAALVVFALIDLFELGAGEAASLPTAIALIVLILIGAAALLTFAVGARRGLMWARSGGVVLQVIAIALALASLTVQPVVWPFVLGVGIPGLLGFILLIASTRKEARVVAEPDAESET
ncbi:hypothetical protein ACTU6V_09685 [Microbacterium sp. A204]|uniref:hypothetical protein n=1 Tax=Microbacterium sp. A204 TaxID=3457321 RepID=UPI003FCF52D1